MSTVRKVDPTEAADWDLDLAPFVLEAILERNASEDRVGLTRIDRGGANGGEHAWRARVYHGNSESHRQFADSLYGGTEDALRAAIDWRNAMRQQIGKRPPRPGPSWRLVMVDDAKHKLIGFYAYADRRRYFSASKHGGWAGAKAAAEAWLRERELSAPST